MEVGQFIKSDCICIKTDPFFDLQVMKRVFKPKIKQTRNIYIICFILLLLLLLLYYYYYYYYIIIIIIIIIMTRSTQNSIQIVILKMRDTSVEL